MRLDANAYANQDIVRTVLVELWANSTPADIINGSATGEFDLTPFAHKVTQTDSKMSLDLRYNTALLDCSAQPSTGQVITIKTDGLIRFSGVIESIDQFTEERGTRTMSITARLRDGFGGWRTTQATSAVYPQGTSYVNLVEDICNRLMGLETIEYSFPNISYTVPHTNAQFADETPWSMLENVLLAANMQPYVDVVNRMSAHDKSVVRASTLDVSNEQVVKIHGTKQTQGTSKVRLKWLDPVLERTAQQDQLLYTTSMTAGFFDIIQDEDAWFSEDRTQRAEGTYMVIKDSVNAGMMQVATEEYTPQDLYHGEIRLRTLNWVPSIATAGIAGMKSASAIPDGVLVAETVSVGRLIETLSNTAILLTMMSIGVGRYEIRGVPFDYVNAKNTTLAYADNIAEWAASEVELDNDLISNEGHAQLIATEHLLWLGASSYAFGVTIVDDPRIEKGDILKFEDGSRLLVQSFSNDYSRGAKATMKIDGFRV